MTAFGSIRVISLSGTVVVGVIMTMGTIFHNLVKKRCYKIEEYVRLISCKGKVSVLYKESLIATVNLYAWTADLQETCRNKTIYYKLVQI